MTKAIDSQNLSDKILARSIISLLFFEKIEKFKPSLSKQHNKMLKIRSEMLKIKKMAKQSSSRKISGKFSGNFSNPGISQDFRDPEKLPRFREFFLKIFRFSGS